VPALHVLRVFANEDGEWGNPLGVFLEGSQVPEPERQRVATELGFSETVFVDDRAAGRLHIYTPQVELPFAGHPTVGTAWLLAREGTPVETLRPPAGDVRVRHAEGTTFVAALPGWGPPFESRQYDSPAEVRALFAPTQTANAYVWAWIDEAAGTIRARSFVPEAGIVEDEATGSAALALCAQLDRPLTIHQGHGSVLICRPLADGWAEAGGNVVLDEVREHSLHD
jgi:predicted PhzF superfamily epimerase YddE/YHI9